jgi:hypothetical protein
VLCSHYIAELDGGGDGLDGDAPVLMGRDDPFVATMLISAGVDPAAKDGNGVSSARLHRSPGC